MNAREKIPHKARALAKKILDLIAEKKSPPMKVFSDELEKALMQELQSGIKLGRQISNVDAMKAHAPSNN